MFRNSDLNAELVNHLFGRPTALKLSFPADQAAAADLAAPPRKSDAQGHDFTHAVMALAALSLSARSILALRS